MRCLCLIVILFMAWLSTNICMLPFFLGTKRVGTTNGLKLSLNNPLDTNSSTYLWTSIVSLGFIIYAGLFGRIASIMRSIWCWIDVLGGNPRGMSSRKTWAKCSSKTMANGWLWGGGGSFGLLLGGKVHSLKALNSWYEVLRSGSLKVRNMSKCPWAFCGLFLWCWDGLKGAKVIFVQSLGKI